MLCTACHVRVRRDFPYCLHCGQPRKGAKVSAFVAPVLSWAGGELALVDPITTVGRETGNDVVLDDPSVSRRHARIVRDREGFLVEDLGSFNGTSVDAGSGRSQRVLADHQVRLADHVTLQFGDVDAVFAQPRSTGIGSKTIFRGTEHTRLKTPGGEQDEVPTATEPLSARPRRRSGWALKQVGGSAAEQRWVLRNTRTGRYLSLDERQVFLFEQLDGRHTVRDLLLGYFDRFGELALPRIEATLHELAEAGLVTGLHGQRPAPELGVLARLGRAVVRNLIRVELTVRNLDPLVERTYRAFGWRLFTPVAVVLLWVLVLAGLFGFWRASQHRALFDVGGAGLVGAAAVLIGYLVATAVHEAAHAFAVKSYGRRVNRGGVMLTMGMPLAFVDTSDMWFGTPWSRIVVAVSGPLATTGLAGGTALTAAYLPDPRIAGVCFQLAFGLYLNTLFNLNPLLPTDGYQALADALRTPRLREEAKEYFSRQLWRDLRARRRPGAREWGLVAFAVASIGCLYGMVVLAAITWNSRLGQLLTERVGQPWRAVLITIALVLLVFPVWYPMARRVAARLRRPRRAVADPPVRPTAGVPTTGTPEAQTGQLAP